MLKIRKTWIDTFRKYNRDDNGNRIDSNISIDWIQIVKVFLLLYGKNSNALIKYQEIAKPLNISTSTVSNAIKAIENCYLKGIVFEKKVIKKRTDNENGESIFRTIGTEISIMLDFEDM